MKSFHTFFAVTVLTLAITRVAAADDGIIHGDRTPPPPPPPTNPLEATTPAVSDDELTTTDIALETVRIALGEMLARY
jgi:hypothetical protein